jgi:hypothetical protein
VFLVAYFVLQLRFLLPEEGNHQAHALEVFNHTAHKVVKDAIFYGRIQATQCVLQESPWPENEQEARFFSDLLD